MSRLSAGTTIGPYRLLDRIGTGSEGTEVWRAVKEEARPAMSDAPIQFGKVALKLIPSGARNLDELRREWEHGSAVRSANVVRAEDVNVSDGWLYIAQELVEGMTFAKLVGRSEQDAHPPASLVLDLAAGAASGLAAIHGALDRNNNQLGLDHRDIKPSNLMVDEFGVVKILDLGIARATRDPTATTGRWWGTPGYMAPEQRLGNPLSPAADTFSLCLVIWELHSLSGPLLDEDRIMFWESARAGRLPAAANRLLPPSLARIVSKGLEFDPQKRHADGAALLDAIQREDSSGPGSVDLMRALPRGKQISGANKPIPGGQTKEWSMYLARVREPFRPSPRQAPSGGPPEAEVSSKRRTPGAPVQSENFTPQRETPAGRPTPQRSPTPPRNPTSPRTPGRAPPTVREDTASRSLVPVTVRARRRSPYLVPVVVLAFLGAAILLVGTTFVAWRLFSHGAPGKDDDAAKTAIVTPAKIEPVAPAPPPAPACPDQDDDLFLPCDTDAARHDCDDNAADVYPGAPERCDGRNTGCTEKLPADEIDGDKDGYAPCTVATGVVLADGFFGGDPDDGDPNVWPGHESRLKVPKVVDADHDGSPKGQDCDDHDPSRQSNCDQQCGAEVCGNGLDDDCDGSVDEGCTLPTLGGVANPNFFRVDSGGASFELRIAGSGGCDAVNVYARYTKPQTTSVSKISVDPTDDGIVKFQSPDVPEDALKKKKTLSYSLECCVGSPPLTKCEPIGPGPNAPYEAVWK